MWRAFRGSTRRPPPYTTNCEAGATIPGSRNTSAGVTVAPARPCSHRASMANSSHRHLKKFSCVWGERNNAVQHDSIRVYSRSGRFVRNAQYTEYDSAYIAMRYRYADPDGRKWMDGDLLAKGFRSGYDYEYKGVASFRRVPPETMRKLDAEGRLHFTGRGGIRIKRYLDEMKGLPLTDTWTDIPPVNSQARERIGYPTQKPLALLNRIIEASSNEGDVVLDPLYGCATACVAAHALGRLWTGIDISPNAAELMVHRLQQDRMGQEADLTTQAVKVIHRTDIPRRTDTGPLPPYKTHKHTLYGKQEGKCAGCGHHFPFQNFTVDHIVAKSKGGTDHLENLQLLCNHCNSVKGTMDQAAFVAKLKASGFGA